MSTSGYTPKYGSVDEIPLTGPGSPGTPDEISHNFTVAEKQRALRVAESGLEADVNDGYEITAPEDVHRTAAELLASYVLTFGPESPQSIRSGEFADAGEGRDSYASKYKQLYDEFVDAINAAGGDESGGGGGDGTGGGSDWDSGTYGFEVL